MAKNVVPVGAPLWMVTFADLMSLLVCFFVLIISFSVPDIKKLKIVAGSMRDAFGFQREMIVTGMVEIDGNPHFEYARELVPVPIEATVGPIPDNNDDIAELSRREEVWQELLDEIELDRPQASSQRTDAASEEEQRFARIEHDLRQAMQSVPELERLADNLVVERAPEGLRIQIVDQERTSMFPLGSARMYGRTTTLLRQVAKAISSLPNKISIAGHTDSLAYRSTDGYDNWSLSLDRADATRRTLLVSGLDRQRIAAVIGKADTEHVFPKKPLDPRNRRISITLLREQPSPGRAGDVAEKEGERHAFATGRDNGRPRSIHATKGPADIR
jgi:chemotaxis protein MotB